MSVPKKNMMPMNDETRIALLEQNNVYINESLNDIKSAISALKQDIHIKFEKIHSDLILFKEDSAYKFQKIDEKFDNKFEKVETKLERLRDSVDDKFRWTMGVIVTLFSGLYATALGGMIARLCHWI